MLTPAEETGLHGLKLLSLVRKALHDVPQEELITLIHTLREEATRRGLFYLRNGQVETVRILPQPLTAMPQQLSYIRYVALTILSALKRLPDCYLDDPAVRATLPLEEEEDAWLREFWSPFHREHNPVFGRLDAVVDPSCAMWKDTLRFVEPNLSGVGGLHLSPNADQLVVDLVLPLIRARDSRLQLTAGQDVRELLVQEILDHLEAIGRPAENICFVEPKYAESGPDEQEALARFCHERHGMRIMHADPAELVLEGEEVLYQGRRIDLAYRDYEVRDLIALRRQGADVEPIRALFRQNRIVSSIAGDFDHKSCWEILSDSRFTQKYCNPEERAVFQRHILWTRVLSDRRTRLPGGHEGPLLEYARREHESLVLKPNRSFGGDRILIGHTVTRAQWDAAVDAALADREPWVVQQLATIPVNEFPVIGPDGRIHLEPFYTVMGFAPSRYGLATLVRVSQKQVVNVAQRGGMAVILLGRPPGGVVGPTDEPP